MPWFNPSPAEVMLLCRCFEDALNLADTHRSAGAVTASPARRILIRGVNWLGDAVMSTPALLRLREANPAARIALLTPEKLAPLWEYHPAIDDIVSFQSRESALSIGRQLFPLGAGNLVGMHSGTCGLRWPMAKPAPHPGAAAAG
jgi:hypothetical protein